MLRGTRMPVEDILNNYEAGVEPNEIAQLFELPLEQVRQVLDFLKRLDQKVMIRVSRRHKGEAYQVVTFAP